MARIKKRGLDYFPLDTDFITHRTVRRLMKREGDGAVGILVWLFSCIYADKGYYLEVDDVLLEDIAEPGLGRLLLLRPGGGVQETDLILGLKLREDLGRRRHLQPGTVDVLR